MSARYTWAGGYGQDPRSLARILLEMGFVLIKATRSSHAYAYDIRSPQEITPETWFAIHPMYWAGLGLKGV
jgi:hypothetical protein